MLRRRDRIATWGKCLEDPRRNVTKKMGKMCFHLELETQQAPNNVFEEGRGAVLLWCTPWAYWVAKLCVRESRRMSLGIQKCGCLFGCISEPETMVVLGEGVELYCPTKRIEYDVWCV